MKPIVLFIASALSMLTAFPFRSEGRNEVRDTLELNRALATTPAKLLQGQVSGLRTFPIDGNVNGVTNTLIRGVNSIRSDSQPLWIVDGVEINGTLNKNKDAFFQYGEKSYTAPLNALAYLDLYDIESIEVIKDLSATSLYGTRGANGVILIRTKAIKTEGFVLDWNSDFGIIKNAFSNSHHFAISSNKGQTHYSVSAYYRALNGAISGNDQLYGGLRAAFDTKANKTVWFGMNVTASLGEMNSITGTSYFGQPSLTMSLRKPDFFPYDTEAGWRADYDDEAIDRRLTNGVWLTFNLTKALRLKTTVGLDFQNNNRYIWYGKKTSFGKENNGAAAVIGTTVFKYNAKSDLSFNYHFGHTGHLTADLAVEAIGEWTKFNTLNGTDFFSHALRAHGIELSASNAIPHKYDHEYNSRGVYLNAAYTHKDKVGVDGSLRWDNTPRYDDTSFIFYKAGSVWYSPIPQLKLSAGYGEAGREQYVPYGLFGQYISGEYQQVADNLSMFYEGLNRNKSAEWHVDADVFFLKGRYTAHFGYYDKYTTDNFHSYCFGVAVDDHYWKYGARKKQFSQSTLIANRGFEADFNLGLIRSGDFKLDIYSHAAYNINQFLKVDPNDAKGRAVGSGVFVNANVIGHPVGALYGYLVDDQGNFIDTDKDGFIDEYDKDIIGNPNPKVYGSLGAVLSYGRFNLDLLFTGAAGFDILNLNDLLFNEQQPYEISEKYLEKGDYLKLDMISLSYELPLRFKWIKSCCVSLSARDLFTATSYSGWDPEVNCFGTTYLSSGVDYGSYPKYRTYILGAKLRF